MAYATAARRFLPDFAAPGRRVRRWWLERLPYSDALTLNQRNVYILPTRAGWMMALTLLLLLVGSINYQLNLGYLLTFLLAGSCAAGMHVCHANLRGLTMRLSPPEPCFAGQALVLRVTLVNPSRRWRRGVGLRVLPAPDAMQDDVDGWAWVDVPPRGDAEVEVACPMPRRGRHRVPTLSAETRYPLGIFRVWCLWRPAAEALVFPAPEQPAPPLPPGTPRAGTQLTASALHGGGDAEGVRAYRRGDPLKLIVWKKAARSWSAQRNELVSRDTQNPQAMDLWLDHAQCGVGDVEQRLRRLTAWVLAADRLGLDHGLRLPGQELAPDQGPGHQRRCLEALALC